MKYVITGVLDICAILSYLSRMSLVSESYIKIT